MRGILLPLCLTILPLVPARLRAQCPVTDPNCTGGGSVPTVSINPASGAVSTASVTVTINWSSAEGLNASSRSIKINNVESAGSFTYTATDGSHAQSQGTVSLTGSASVTVSARICDVLSHCSSTVSATYSYQAPPQVIATQSQVSRVPSAVGNEQPGLETFRVVNPSTLVTQTFSLEAVCTNVFSCTPAAGQVTVAPGDTAIVGVSYRVGSYSQETVGLVAHEVTAGGTGSASTAVNATASLVAPGGVGDRADLTLSERSMCVTASVGAGAAYECGDLRLVAPLPSTRVLNRARTPVLIYNSQHAKPFPIVAAHVVRDLAKARPDSIGARLVVSGGEVANQRWAGFPAGDTARVALGFDASGTQYATGFYPYHFEVTAYYPGGTSGVIYSRDGRIAIVNRAQSGFGSGWWLAGMEQLVAVGTTELLWVGGDGSTRVYQKAADGVSWIGPAFDRPDTIRAVNNELVRTLPGGAKIYYDMDGRHRRTVNPLGHTTRFEYNGAQLARIVVPLGTDSVAYFFNYNAGVLAEVVAPGVRGMADSARVVRLEVVGRDVRRIYEPQYRVNAPSGSPMNTARPHVLLTTTNGRITDRTSPGGTPTTFFRYDAAGLLSGTALGLAPGDSIRLGFRAAESQGIAGPVAQSVVYTRLDGPRTDVGDTTKFVLDRWGAPVRVVDAMGNATQIRRENPALPALVTSVVYPNGRWLSASYDPRGNLIGTTDWSHFAGNRYAATAYAYDPKWDAVTRTTSAEGVTSAMAYDSLGRPAWTRQGPDPARRVTFQYRSLTGTAPGLAASVTQPAAAGNPAAVESYEYDARGNLSAVVSPLGVRSETLSDEIGRPVRTRQQINMPALNVAPVYQSDSTVYDELGRVARSESMGPAIASSRTGRPASPAQKVVVVNRYDAASRLRSVSRVSLPDSAGVDTVTTRFAYDAANRKIAELAPDTTPADSLDNPADSTWYDPAGNVIRTKSRLGETVTFQYDTLNRLRRRFVPAATRRAISSQVQSSPPWYFPYFRDNGTGALETLRTDTLPFALRGDTAVFTYDEMGNMRSAVNQDASIARTYSLYGSLQSETQRIRTYVGQDTTTHVYQLQYGYDLDGRRTTLTLPGGLQPGSSQTAQTYSYDPGTGELLNIRDALGTDYTYAYDARGRTRTFTRNGVQERYGYDNGGRMTSRYEEHLATHQALHDETMAYDGRGKLTLVQTLQGDTVQNEYTGLGALAGSYTMRQMIAASEERFRVDALGNQYNAVQRSQDGFKYTQEPDSSVKQYQPFTARQRASRGTTYSEEATFDRAGNRDYVLREQIVPTPYNAACTSEWSIPLLGILGHFSCGGADNVTASLVDLTRQYYGADGRLRLLDRRTCLILPDNTNACDTSRLPLGNQRSAFEEYRYDALGRRILVRSRQAYLCQTNCQNVVRRTVWDGDQVLAEIQAPGATGTSPTLMESDGGLVVHVDAGSVVLPDSLLAGADVAPSDTMPQAQIYRGFQYGRVVYTHGPGIDAPLSLIRMDYSDSIRTPQLVVLHSDWRGEYDIGSYAGGTLTKPCVHITRSSNFKTTTPDGTISDYPKAPGPLNTSWYHCVEVEWPAPHVWVTRETRNRSINGPLAWMGTLIDGMRDNSGQMYMRNRYYDPASGRFTQEDPIGLAGGLNAYGFAAGDPVSYGDPYGLDPCKDPARRNDPGCPRLWPFSMAGKISNRTSWLGQQQHALWRYLDSAPGRIQVMGLILGAFSASGGGSVDAGVETNVPGAVNSRYGKVDFLLGNVRDNASSVGKGPLFRNLLGFDETTLEPALHQHAVNNLASAALRDGNIQFTGPMVGANGRTLDMVTIWRLSQDGSTLNFVTSYRNGK
ncbi:RHS repeat-associated core domain-containing protein [Longimicrobium sp.]|uniref:RHS repeat-associated core domain-containing protein n=1 Tax=Longimicrobium sp. TaxID=2029185 RepID=UPI002C4F2ED3|nr:RHS repeat-associated core domain-containing protein [Longimicrobium sp.]HSU13608.1 RHS repeat-associated core domain-containing protein [Longimicrobium sp.]